MSRSLFRFVRKYVKVFLWIIAILIIPSFILWGVGTAIRDQSRARYAGTIFKHPVSWNEFDRAYQTTVMLLVLSDLGAYLSFLDPEAFTWDRLILLQEVKKKKLRVPDQDVVDYVQKIPAFRDQDGFNRRSYEETLKLRFRTDPRTFEEEVRKTLAISKLRDEVMAEAVLDDEALWKEYRAQNDKRRVATVEFETERFEKEVSLADEELKSYFEANAKAFERPEQIRLQTAGLAFGEGNQKEIRRRLDEAYAALTASDAEKEPNAFETIAKEKELLLKTTDFFSLFKPPADLPEELLVEATRSKPGVGSEPIETPSGIYLVSEPIETPSGIYLVKLLDKKPPQVPSFEEARSEVEKVLKREKAESLCQEKARGVLQEIQAKLANEKVSFEDAVKAAGVSFKETAPFSRGEPIEGMGDVSELNRAAFALSLNEAGGIVRTPKGFAILKPKEEIPASREDFEKGKAAFREKVLKQKQTQHFNEWFQVLKANAKLQSNLEAQKSPEPVEEP